MIARHPAAGGSRGLARDAAKMLTSSVGTQALGLGSAILLRRFLGPSAMGTWTLLLTVLGYAGLSHVGTLHAAEREFPRALAEDDLARASAIRSAAALVCLVGAGLAAVACAGWALLHAQASASMGIIPAYLAIAVIVQQSTAFHSVILRGQKQFGVLSGNGILVGTLSACLLPVGAAAAGLPGVLVAALVVAGAGLFQLVRYSDQGIRTAGYRELVPLLRAGFPMFIYILSFMALRTLDRVAIGSRMDVTALGEYSVAILLSTYLFMIPNTISPVLYPRLQELFVDAGKDRKSVV